MYAIAGVLLLVDSALAVDKAVSNLCPRVRFIGGSVKLSDTEKKLVCGDPESDGWKRISLPQAKQFMTAFLQSRGYHFPEFQAAGETLEVRVGTTTTVRKLTGNGLGGIYDLGKRRKIVGQLLTPALLNKVQQGVIFELQNRGYACPVVAVSADAGTGEVHVEAEVGDVYRLSNIRGAQVEGIDPAAFNRYWAFRSGQTFEERLLSVTSDRIKTDDLFLSAYFDVSCSSEGVRVVQRVVEGKPHLVTIGIGFDTEGLLQGKLQMKESRIGRRASSAEFDAFASKLQQSLDTSANLYFSDRTRWFVYPDAFVRREDQVPYQAAHSQASVSPSWSHDGDALHFETRAGPAYDYFNTIVGEGPQRSSWLAFVTRSRIMSHLYEYYATDPQVGWAATLETSSRYREVYSRITANRIQLSGEGLWNLGRYEPPLLLLATRGMLGTTDAQGDTSLAFSQVPPTERFFLGGDANIRGFPLERLPDDAEGFLTTLYDGVELRAGDVFPAKIEPLVFIDAAMGARRDFHLDPDVYYAPGAGVRWGLPFGSVRMTFARGLTWRNGGPTEPPPPNWQFFFSFGREF